MRYVVTSFKWLEGVKDLLVQYKTNIINPLIKSLKSIMVNIPTKSLLIDMSIDHYD